MEIGSKARIVKLDLAEAAYKQRLIAMGLVPGAEILLKRIAPLGDPVEIIIKGFALSLRKKEADILQLEPIN